MLIMTKTWVEKEVATSRMEKEELVGYHIQQNITNMFNHYCLVNIPRKMMPLPNRTQYSGYIPLVHQCQKLQISYTKHFDAKIHECKLILSFKNSQIEGLKNLWIHENVPQGSYKSTSSTLTVKEENTCPSVLNF